MSKKVNTIDDLRKKRNMLIDLSKMNKEFSEACLVKIEDINEAIKKFEANYIAMNTQPENKISKSILVKKK